MQGRREREREQEREWVSDCVCVSEREPGETQGCIVGDVRLYDAFCICYFIAFFVSDPFHFLSLLFSFFSLQLHSIVK